MDSHFRCASALVLFFCCVLGSQAQIATANYHRVSISDSKLTIYGTTNVNTFRCSMREADLNDSIVVKNIWSNQVLEFEGLVLKFRVDQFKCGLPGMSSDLQELLKAEEEPYLYLTLKSIALLPDNDAFEELDVDALVDIYLAGVTREVQVRGGKVRNRSEAHLSLSGSKEIRVTDFNLEPPTKMFGTIKVSDEIKISFEIDMVVSPLEMKKAARK